MQKDKKTEAALFWQRLDQLIGQDEPYAWAARHGITKGTFQSARTRQAKPLSRTLKAWAASIGCNYEWLESGIGEPFASKTMQETTKIVNAKVQEYAVSTKDTDVVLPDLEILRLAISTLHEALAITGKTMPVDAQTEMVMKLYVMYSTQKGNNIKNYVLELIRELGVTT